jgi:hypothetical protein
VHNDEIHNCTHKQLRCMRWEGHVACMGGNTMGSQKVHGIPLQTENRGKIVQACIVVES